ncbi:MAG: type I 3-dehydroquinate dehydratase [Desulfobulbaceae bacterium]|nr:type I 3-dehydroquinate dehydratase [Desulfobulbaceae bacterium]
MDKGMVCVSVAAENAKSVASAVRPVLDIVDVIEVRLDAMKVPQVKGCCELLTKPLLFTNRPDWEGGEFEGPEGERIEPLFEAIEAKAAFVDFELNGHSRYRNQLLDAMEGSATRMIISCHDFQETPSSDRLADLLKEQMDSGAHIGKIVTVAHDPFDVLRVLNLLEEASKHDFPLCAFCMGETGRISRLTTLFFGGFMTYGALNETQATAPGQLSVRVMRDLLRTCQKQLG